MLNTALKPGFHWWHNHIKQKHKSPGKHWEMLVQAQVSRSQGGVPSSEFLEGMRHPVLQIMTQFQSKIGQKPYPFSDLTTRFQTW